ncbi:hypothetical protein IKN40_00565 [bacterium]|nr:hypothetical protein [bacterium]
MNTDIINLQRAFLKIEKILHDLMKDDLNFHDIINILEQNLIQNDLITIDLMKNDMIKIDTTKIEKILHDLIKNDGKKL